MKRLQWLLTAAAGGMGIRFGTLAAGKKWKSRVERESNKYWESYLMMDRWVRKKQEGKSLIDYFEENRYYSIAVYGMSHAGITLLDELSDSGIKVKYGIDMNADKIYSDIPVFKPSDSLEEVDVVVVTPVYYFDEIEKNLSEKMSCPIIPLDDVIFYS